MKEGKKKERDWRKIPEITIVCVQSEAERKSKATGLVVACLPTSLILLILYLSSLFSLFGMTKHCTIVQHYIRAEVVIGKTQTVKEL